jgi:hypothetical protein
MRSSRHISLFSARPELSQRPTSVVVSLVAHAAALLLLSFGIIYTPEIHDRVITKRYAMRHLDLQMSKPIPRQSAGKGFAYPGPHNEAYKQPAPGPKPAAQRAVMRVTADADKGPQTLVQPDISQPLKMALEAPMPSLTIWTPSKVQVKSLVAPLPEKATASDVMPSVRLPNQAVELADVGISSSDHPTTANPIPPTTTSPLTVHQPNMVELAPITVTQTAAQPTPAAVMSISDLRMPDGAVTLPPVNETVLQSEMGPLAPGQAAAGDGLNREGGKGTEEASGDGGEPLGVVGTSSGTKTGSSTGSGADQGLTTERFTLPKNGQFGAVVVGASLEEAFPEMSGIWNDRVAYTVYLHVGLSKSWILQYSLPRNVEAEDAGNVTRLEAPWPYNIVRPNLAADAINSDALLVHGFVSAAGKFESLGVAFPPQFPMAQFVLDALNQWQFRPAAREGKTERVEVLLIIPEERDE